MSIPRIYQPTIITSHTHLRLDAKASHHLARVLRAKIGDELTLFNGHEDNEYPAVITHIDKKSVEVDVAANITRNIESPLNIYLAQGITRGEKMDFIIQKAVELGVRKIFPLLTERCSVKHDSMREEKRLAHWQAVVISACEQSGRNRMPDVAAAMTLTQWLTSAAPSVRGVVLSPHVDNKLTRTSEEKKSILLNNQLPLAVLIGPEGGLSEAEMQQAYQHGFLPLQLGPRVLRAETATIAALAILQAWLGDMGADVRE